MSRVYSEGPFRNWTAVNFPDDVYFATVSYSTAGGVLVITKRETLITEVADLQGVFTGKVSGVSIDTSALPFSASPSFSSEPCPTCTRTLSNYFDLSGSSVTATPNVGWAITGTPGLGVFAQSFSSQSPDADPCNFCQLDFNAPAFPAFINDEDVDFVPAVSP